MQSGDHIVSDSVLTLLRFALLGLLYLFFLRVLFSVWSELRPTGKLQAARAGSGATEARSTAVAPGPVGVAGDEIVTHDLSSSGGAPPTVDVSRRTELVVLEPTEMAGMTFDLGQELTVGRASGCGISIDDTFVSSLHARIFRRGDVYVVEDLGSTNGTFLNGGRLGVPTVITADDTIRFGSTVVRMR